MSGKLGSGKFDSLNEFYGIYTPYLKPLRFSDQYYRIGAKVECRKCGVSKVQILRMPRFRSSLIMAAPLPMPDLSDEKIITSFMVRACDNLVGCYKDCKCGKGFSAKCLKSCALKGVSCDCLCFCDQGCGNRGIYPCKCGWVAANHRPACPVGEFKRTGSFALDAVRSNMISAGKRR